MARKTTPPKQPEAQPEAQAPIVIELDFRKIKWPFIVELQEKIKSGGWSNEEAINWALRASGSKLTINDLTLGEVMDIGEQLKGAISNLVPKASGEQSSSTLKAGELPPPTQSS